MMRQNARLDGTFGNKNITAELNNVPVFIIREDNNFIFYTPVFDVSGYGETEKKAAESLTVAVNEFFRYTTNKNTFESELLKLGWKKEKKKKFSQPTMSDLIKDRPYLAEIMDTHDFKKSSFPIDMPALA